MIDIQIFTERSPHSAKKPSNCNSVRDKRRVYSTGRPIHSTAYRVQVHGRGLEAQITLQYIIIRFFVAFAGAKWYGKQVVVFDHSVE